MTYCLSMVQRKNPKAATDAAERLKERLKEFRDQSGFTQEEAARYADMKISTLQSWEQGKYIPKATSLKPLADLYGRRVGDFFDDEVGSPDFRSVPAFYLVVHPKALVDDALLRRAAAEIAKLNDLYLRRASVKAPATDTPRTP